VRRELADLKASARNQKLLQQQELRNHQFLLRQAEDQFLRRLECNADALSSNKMGSASYHSTTLPSPPLSPTAGNHQRGQRKTKSISLQLKESSLQMLSSLSLSSASNSNHSAATTATARVRPRLSKRLSSSAIMSSTAEGAAAPPSTTAPFGDVDAPAAYKSHAAQALGIHHRPLPLYVAFMKSSYHNPTTASDDATVHATPSPGTNTAPASANNNNVNKKTKKTFQPMPNINIVQKQACVLQAMHWFVQVYPNQVRLVEGFMDELTVWSQEERNQLGLESERRHDQLALTLDERVDRQTEHYKTYQEIVDSQGKLIGLYKACIPDYDDGPNDAEEAKNDAHVQVDAAASATQSSPIRFVQPIIDSIPLSIASSFPTFSSSTSAPGAATTAVNHDANPVENEDEAHEDHMHWSLPTFDSNASTSRLSSLLFHTSDQEHANGVDAHGNYDVLAEDDGDGAPPSKLPTTSSRMNICDDFIVDWGNFDDHHGNDDDGIPRINQYSPSSDDKHGKLDDVMTTATVTTSTTHSSTDSSSNGGQPHHHHHQRNHDDSLSTISATMGSNNNNSSRISMDMTTIFQNNNNRSSSKVIQYHDNNNNSTNMSDNNSSWKSFSDSIHEERKRWIASAASVTAAAACAFLDG